MTISRNCVSRSLPCSANSTLCRRADSVSAVSCGGRLARKGGYRFSVRNCANLDERRRDWGPHELAREKDDEQQDDRRNVDAAQLWQEVEVREQHQLE